MADEITLQRIRRRHSSSSSSSSSSSVSSTSSLLPSSKSPMPPMSLSSSSSSSSSVKLCMYCVYVVAAVIVCVMLVLFYFAFFETVHVPRYEGADLQWRNNYSNHGNDGDGSVASSTSSEGTPISQAVDYGNERILTRFDSMDYLFADIPVTGPEHSIPTLSFLDACLSLSAFFEYFHAKTWNLGIAIIRDNMKTIRHNYQLEPELSATLQDMMIRDMTLGLPRMQSEDSTLVRITRLKRALSFISNFLSYVAAGDEVPDAARKSYDSTLALHHSFMVKVIFRAALHSLSPRSVFLQGIAMNESDFERQDFEQIVVEELKNYNSALSRMLGILDDFFAKHQLPS